MSWDKCKINERWYASDAIHGAYTTEELDIEGNIAPVPVESFEITGTTPVDRTQEQPKELQPKADNKVSTTPIEGEVVTVDRKAQIQTLVDQYTKVVVKQAKIDAKIEGRLNECSEKDYKKLVKQFEK